MAASKNDPGAGPWISNDEKTNILTNFILPHLQTARKHSLQPRQGWKTAATSDLDSHFSFDPLIVGLSGIQGTGKSTIANLMAKELTQQGFETRVISIDDFYLTLADRQNLHSQQPDNALLKARGQPGTHDLALAKSWMEQFNRGVYKEKKTGRCGKTPLIWPSFDKSAKGGKGDRVNTHMCESGSSTLECIILEGWCVGFQAIEEREIALKHRTAIRNKAFSDAQSTLSDHSLGDVCYVNDKLRQYNETFLGPQHLDLLIHLDAEELQFVYDWRLEQEREMRKRVGSGMSDAEVVDFVETYMPAYELYLSGLRNHFYASQDTQTLPRHLRVVNSRDRHFLTAKVV